MAGRVNTKFVVLLSSIIVLVVLAVVGVYMLKVMRSAEELIQKGDQYLAQNQPRMAIENYGRAIGKRPNDVELLQKYVATLRTIDVKDNVEARKYLGQIQNGTRQASEVDPTNEELLEDYYELQLSLAGRFGGRGVYDELHRLASVKLQQYPDNLTARKYRGIAQVNRLSTSMARADQLEAYNDLLKVYEVKPDDAQVAHHLARWSLFEADRLEQTAGSPQEIQKLRTNALEVSRQMLAVDPADLDRRLMHLSILLHPRINAVDEARPIAQQIEADLLERPEPDTAVIALIETLPRLDTQVVSGQGGRDTTRGMQRAQRLLEAAVAAHPDRVLFRTILGRIYTMQGHAEPAIEQFAAAWELGATGPAIEALQAYSQRVTAGLEEIDLRLGQLNELDDDQQQALLRQADQRITLIEQMVGENGATLLLRGKLAMIRREFGVAMQTFDKAAEQLAGSPDEVEALMMSARARLLSGERGAAAEQLDKIVQRLPTAAPVLLELAELRLDMKQFDQAQAAVDRLLNLDPQNSRARILHARLLAGRGHVAEAVAAYEALNPQANPQILLPLAQLYAAQGDEDKARQLIGQSFEQAPQDVRVLGVMLQTTDDKQAQFEMIERSRAAGGNAAVLNLLQRQIESGDTMTRQELVEQLIEQQDDPVLRELAQADLHRRGGEAEQAKAALDRAAAINADHPQVIERQFEYAMSQAQWDQAQRAAARAGSLNLDLASGAFYRGQLAAARGRVEEAIAEYRRGLAARPVYSEGWRRMGDAQSQAGNQEAAADAYRRALDQRPDNVRAIRGLASVADARGDHAAALRHIREALRHDANDRELLVMYLAYEQQHGDPAQALRLREQLAEANPADTGNRRALAMLLAHQDRFDDATATVQALMDEDGQSLANVQTAAAVHAMAGNVDAGRQLIEQHIAARGDEAAVDDLLALARYLLSVNAPDALDAYHRARSKEDPAGQPVTRELADLLFARGANAQALPLYRELLTRHPDDARVGLRYAEALIRAGETTEAEAVLARFPDQASGQVLTATLAMQQEDRAGAIRALERGLRIDPNNVLARIQLAALLADDPGQVNRARELLNEALRLAPDSAEAHLAMASLHQRLGEVPEAIQQMRSVLNRQPNNTAARLRLVDLYTSRSDFAAADRLLEEAATRDPQNSDWPRLRSRLASRHGNIAMAIEHARKNVELAPSPAGVAELATLLLTADRASEALALLEEHVVLVNAEPALQGIRGWALAKSGQTEPARQVFIRAIERAANLPQTLTVTGRMAAALGNGPAIELLSSLEPPRPTWLQLAMAELEIQEQRYRAAARRLDGLRADSTSGDPQAQMMHHRLLGMARHQSGDAPGAQRAYERLLELAPDDVATLNNLAYLLVEDLDQPQKGLPLAERAARLQPDNPQILDTLGWAQFKARQYNQARTTLERSVDIRPLAPSCYHLARVYAELGVTSSATQHVKQAIELAQQNQDDDVLPRAQALLDQLSRTDG